MTVPIGTIYDDIARARRESGWTALRTEIATRLWEAGASAAQIACQLGGVSRNAVIGKLTRVNAGGHGSAPTAAGSRSRLPRGTHRNDPTRGRKVTIRSAMTAPQNALTRLEEALKTAPREPGPVRDSDRDIPAGQRVTMLGLTSENCHWPVGDPQSPEFFFCGAKALSGYSYCAHHTRRAYEVGNATPRNRRRGYKASRWTEMYDAGRF